MVTRIAVLGYWTAVEAVRERILYIVLLFAGLLVGSSCILSPLAPGAQAKVVADFGLACIHLLGVLVILLSGATLVRREVERRSLDVILTKPVSRLEYLVGKCLGLVATLAALGLAMTLVFAVTLKASGFGWSAAYLDAILASWFEWLVVASIAVLFSTFTSPTLAALFTLALFAAGHLAGSGLVPASADPNPVVRVIGWLLPALGIFNLRGEVVHGVPVPMGRLLVSCAYAVLYALTALYVASLVFRRRDFR